MESVAEDKSEAKNFRCRRDSLLHSLASLTAAITTSPPPLPKQSLVHHYVKEWPNPSLFYVLNNFQPRGIRTLETLATVVWSQLMTIDKKLNMRL